MDTIGFIGAGNMAEAFIRGIIKADVCAPDAIIAADVVPERLEYLKAEYGNLLLSTIRRRLATGIVYQSRVFGAASSSR